MMIMLSLEIKSKMKIGNDMLSVPVPARKENERLTAIPSNSSGVLLKRNEILEDKFEMNLNLFQSLESFISRDKISAIAETCSLRIGNNRTEISFLAVKILMIEDLSGKNKIKFV